ncbi:putative aminohydrolase SsnA [bacterium]|nr:putative aminohydrolase SsnA [candidate division CSSED10-310 bacterium]
MLLINGRILTMNETFDMIDDGAVRIVDGCIVDVDSTQCLTDRYRGETCESVCGAVIMPGNICAHTHFYGAYARGLSIPGEAPAHFLEILRKLWWRLDKALTPESVRTSADVCLIDAIRRGTTTIIDHHASPSCIDGSLDIIADAVLESGVRASLCYEVTDRNGFAEADAGIAENIRFIHRCQADKHPLLSATFGLHASLTLSDRTLKRCVSELNSESTGFHIHAAEAVADQSDSLNRHGMRVIERLHRLGIVGPRSILAHCVHIDSHEIEILAKSGAFVTHQPRSNMNNAVGTAPVESMLRHGIPVALGNDGFSNNMWAEWKAAFFSQKAATADPRQCQGFDVMTMAWTNNRKLIRTLWPEQIIGVIEPGASADLIVVDYYPYTPFTPDNLPWHCLFGFETDMIRSTMIRGRWVMKNRLLTTLDESAVIRRAFQAAPSVWNRFQEVSRAE